MRELARIQANHPLSTWFDTNGSIPSEDQIINLMFSLVSSEKDRQLYINSPLSDIPDPVLAKGVSEGVLRLLEVIDKKQKVMIVGDYDVDGITSTVLLIRFFQRIGFTNYSSFIPNRFMHGYGLTDKTVDLILEKAPDVIVTVDNGITARAEIQRLKDNGIEVIITDHHLPQEGELPDCVVINPKQPGCDYPFKELSGVGVVYLLVIALRAELRNRGYWLNKEEPNLLKYLDLVAIGTIADQVPLVGVNRIFAKHGLDQMTRKLHESSPDSDSFYLKTFAEKCRLKSFDSNSITFRLAPMLNAAGRMKDAVSGVHFLLANNEQNALSRYNYIERLNVQRRKTQKVMVRKALKKAKSLISNDKGLVIYDTSFHEGLIGVVASRIVDQFEQPCIVATDSENDYIKASCRSRNVNIMEILHECQDYMLRFGGHANAAGCSIEKDKMDSFHRRFSEVCARLAPKPEKRKYIADIEVDISMMTFDLLDKMRVFEPFGQNNKKPVFVSRNVRLPVPSVLTGKHLKWGLGNNLEIIYWNCDVDINYEGDFDVAFTLSENTYRGVRKRQLIVEAIHPISVD